MTAALQEMLRKKNPNGTIYHSSICMQVLTHRAFHPRLWNWVDGGQPISYGSHHADRLIIVELEWGPWYDRTKVILASSLQLSVPLTILPDQHRHHYTNLLIQTMDLPSGKRVGSDPSNTFQSDWNASECLTKTSFRLHRHFPPKGTSTVLEFLLSSRRHLWVFPHYHTITSCW